MTHGFASTLMRHEPGIKELAGILLDNALLCVNCDTIYPAAGQGVNTDCPNCASRSYLKLSKVLNRTEG